MLRRLCNCNKRRFYFPMVGVRGFEPPTPASRRQCSTKLSYTPIGSITIAHNEMLYDVNPRVILLAIIGFMVALAMFLSRRLILWRVLVWQGYCGLSLVA